MGFPGNTRVSTVQNHPQAECAALGNLLIQAITLGHIASHAAAREIVRNSFELKIFTPQDAEQWDAAATRFEKLAG